MMNRLWAPWRINYIRPEKKRSGKCLFCSLFKESSKRDKASLILCRGKFCYVVLNRYPYNNGHLMVVPNRHVAQMHRLHREEKLEWLEFADRAVAALRRHMKPHGINIGVNLGTAAGAGIPKHIHLHVVPRWNGDTNFMPVVGKTKVISESLSAVWSELRPLMQPCKGIGKGKR